MASDTVLFGRALKGLEDVAGRKFATLFIQRLYDEGPQPPERLIQRLRLETERVVKIKGF